MHKNCGTLHGNDNFHERKRSLPRKGSQSWYLPDFRRFKNFLGGYAGYSPEERPHDTEQFDVSDQRSLDVSGTVAYEIGLHTQLLHGLLPRGQDGGQVHVPVQERSDTELLSSQRADDVEGVSDGLCV